jgi:hypothetical protein
LSVKKSSQALERPLTSCAYEFAFLLAFQTHPVKEPLPDHGMMTIRYSRDHVSTIIAKMMHRLLAGNIPLIEVQDDQRHNEKQEDQSQNPARGATVVGLERDKHFRFDTGMVI